MSKEKLFRKKSLARLSSPEQLDQALQITSPAGWLALTALGVLLFMVVVWGIFGSVPVKVHGRGLLIKHGGVFQVLSLGAGQISEVLVNVGQDIKQGDVVARIAQPGLKIDLMNAESQLKERLAEQAKLIAFLEKNQKIDSEAFVLQLRNRKNKQAAQQKEVDFLAKRILSDQQLLKEGLITNATLFNTQQEKAQAELKLKGITEEIEALEKEVFIGKNDAEQKIFNMELAINEHERLVNTLKDRLEQTGTVYSTHTGRVVEIKADPGSVISVGQPVLSVDLVHKPLRAIVYIRAEDGKQVQPGMPIQISPSTVKQEEFGLMVGNVIRVSAYPSTPEGMLALIENEALVKEFVSDGAPIALDAVIEKNPKTRSGFKWTSGSGPPADVTTGTIVTGYVVVKEHAPVELIIPMLREKLGI